MNSALAPGRLVAGRYRLLGQLGRGAMGIVWRGRDELLDRDVAVKQVVLPPLASQDEASAAHERTLREARTAARLSHPGVVTVFDVAEEDGTPWIVMELVRARPLDQVIAEDGPLPPAQAAELGLGLLDALAAAHAAGVLHRDVKPSNVLIGADGKAVLTDFGIATVQGDPGMTQAGMVVGTPGFSSPERLRGGDATPSSDLWSLGATLYAAVEGRGPFERAGGPAAIVATVVTEPAPRAPSAGPLAPVIDALLRADPAARPDAASTAAMLAGALATARRDEADGRTVPDWPGAQDWPAGQSELADRRAPLPHGRTGAEATTATQAIAVPDAEYAAASYGNASYGNASYGNAAYPAEPAPGPTPAGAGVFARPDAGSDERRRRSAAADVIPDLMATPVFSELAMPAQAAPPGTGGTADHPGRAGRALADGPFAQQARGTTARGGTSGKVTHDGGSAGHASAARPGQPPRSRRGTVLASSLAVAAAITAIVYFAFPGFSESLVTGLAQLPRSRAAVSPAPVRHGYRAAHVRGKAGGSATPGAPAHSASPAHSGTPAPSSTPRPSRTSSPSATPRPTGTPAPTLPLGYTWRAVSAATAGATAGFRVAVPLTWLMNPGLTTRFTPLAGAARMSVDLSPFAVQGPVREARYLSAHAAARYRQYHLVSILALTFHGAHAATWTFWWRPRAGGRAVDVSEVIVTAQTSAGPQPYILAMSAPAPRASSADRVFRVALRTFTHVP